MKRSWEYVAAFVPFTTALLPTNASAFVEDEEAAGRTKKNGLSDELEDDATDGRSDGDGGHGDIAHGSSYDTGNFDDDASGNGSGGGGGSALNGNPSDPIIHQGGGMYDPSLAGGSGGTTYSNGSGGGGGGFITKKTVITVEGRAGGDGYGLGPNEANYVDPDPDDADAMMVVLGGLAEGSGDGAESSGEVVFDIVDYGMLTIGYGYSTYKANGSDGASADTYADVYGADIVFTYDTGESFGTEAYSSTYVLALDFEDDAAAESYGGLDAVYWTDLLGQSPFEQWVVEAQEEEEDVSIDDNSALLALNAEAKDTEPVSVNSSFEAINEVGSTVLGTAESEQASLKLHGEAQGIETLATATGNLLEIEDDYSLVGGTVTMIA